MYKKVVGGTAAAIALMMAFMPVVATANEAGDIRNQLNATNVQAAEAEGHVNDLDNQIDRVQAQIDNTQAEIAATNAAIADAKAKLAVSQAKLGELVSQQYKNANQQTDLEKLVGSKNLSDYVDKQQYLQAGQDKISDAMSAVYEAKRALDAKAAQLGTLNAQLAQQQAGLNFARATAQNQLDQINGARAALKAKLAKYGGRVVAVGDYVNAGDLVGFQGNTGYSTGTHLHFEVRQGGSPVNPRNYTPGQLRWPLEPGFGVNQEFGSPNWAAAYSFHTGIDLEAYYGAPVYAAASGVVSFSGFDNTGFGEHVIIDHGGGLQTLYGHLAQGQ